MDDTYVIAELDIELRMFKYKTCRSFIASSFTFECFIHFQFSFASGWKDKEDVGAHTHTHRGISYTAVKNEVIPFAATRMDLEIIVLIK